MSKFKKIDKIEDATMISTKQGDKGTSKNYSSEELLKTNILFDTLGTMDELSSYLGVCFHLTPFKAEIRSIQTTLQHINSHLATNENDPRQEKITQVTIDDINYLEALEDKYIKQTNIKPVFVLPGSDSSKEGAYLDLARALARKAERQVNRFYEVENRAPRETVLQFLNRLSDLLFIMARSLD
jgi:cob(I)alamin adenosyltransferase